MQPKFKQKSTKPAPLKTIELKLPETIMRVIDANTRTLKFKNSSEYISKLVMCHQIYTTILENK